MLVTRRNVARLSLRYVGHARSLDTAVHPVGTVHSTAGYSGAVWVTNTYRHSAVMSVIDMAGFSIKITHHTASIMYVLYTAYMLICPWPGQEGNKLQRQKIRVSYTLPIIIIGGILVLFIRTIRLESN